MHDRVTLYKKRVRSVLSRLVCLQTRQLVQLWRTGVFLQHVELFFDHPLALLSQDVVGGGYLEQNDQEENYLDGKVDVFLLLDLLISVRFSCSFRVRWDAKTDNYEDQLKESSYD